MEFKDFSLPRFPDFCFYDFKFVRFRDFEIAEFLHFSTSRFWKSRTSVFHDSRITNFHCPVPRMSIFKVLHISRFQDFSIVASQDSSRMDRVSKILKFQGFWIPRYQDFNFPIIQYSKISEGQYVAIHRLRDSKMSIV